MIDDIKLEIAIPEPSSLLNNGNLNWIVQIDHQTGEIYHYWMKYKNLYCKLKGSILTLENSPHTFKDGNNSTQFTFENCVEVYKELSQLFGINLFNSLVRSFEFGVNISLDKSPKEYLDQIGCFKPKGFVEFDKTFRGNQLKYSSDGYSFKIYNKSHQLQIEGNVMRFEVKRKSASKYLQQLTRLNELISPETFNILGTELLKMFDKIIFMEYSDSSTVKELSTNDYLLLSSIIELGLFRALNPIKVNRSKKQYQYRLEKVKRFKERGYLIPNPSESLLRSKIQEELQQIYSFNNVSISNL